MVKNTSKKQKEPKKEKIKKVEEPIFNVKITIIKEAPSGKEFILCNGKKIKDLRELAFTLEEIGNEIFGYHVNDARNDFANWIHDVFEEKELADTIRGIRDKLNTQLTIMKHIVQKL